MKTVSKLTVYAASITMAVVMLLAGQANGQNPASGNNAPQVKHLNAPQGRPMAMLPGLTDDQKAKIKDLMTSRQEDNQLMKAQLDEKKAHLRLLTLNDSPDRKAIDKTIDEITAINGQQMKRGIDIQLSMKKILNKEQFQAWEMQKQKGKKNFGPQMRQRAQQGMKQGQNFRVQQGFRLPGNQPQVPAQAAQPSQNK